MVVLRPGYVEVSLGAALVLLSAGLIGTAAVLVKKLSATDAPEGIAIWMVVLQTPITLIAALFVWQWPSAETFGWLLCLALAGTIGHLCWTRAVSMAEVSQLQPFEFAKLPFVAIIAFFAFSEVPTVWVWIGGAIIIERLGWLDKTRHSSQKQACPHAYWLDDLIQKSKRHSDKFLTIPSFGLTENYPEFCFVAR